MQIKLDKKQNKALYIQLYESISEDIMLGRLRNGVKLPARRALSEQLGISQNTVEAAYKMLLDTGYIISVPRQGYIVSFKALSYNGDKPWEVLAPEEVVFSPNGIDTSRINRAAYAKISRDISYNDGIDIFSYVDKGGEFILRNAISKYLYSFRDVKCSPDRIIVGAGAEYLLDSLSALFPADTSFIMENPCDPHFYSVLALYNNKVTVLPWNTGRFDFNALYASNGNILFIEPDLRFPRNSVMSQDEREQLLDWANQKEDRFIIENCCDSEIAWESENTLFSMDKNNKVIYIGSFSRSFCPAVKTSYMVLPPEILALWKRKHIYYYALTSKIEQFTLAEFINKGYFTKHFKAMRRIYKDKRDYLISCINEAFVDNIDICSSSGSTYICADFNLHSEEIKTLARRNGVKLFSLNSFNPLKNTECTSMENDKLVFGFGDLNKEKIHLGVQLLKDALL